MAAMWVPAGAMMPPLASSACAVASTLFTRAIMANTALSAMSVAWMPRAASSSAMRRPW
jgi:hypothetical protein